MPRLLPKPCRHPGCGALTRSRFCTEHERAHAREYDQQRGSAASRGYGVRHRRWRELILARDPLCVDPFGVHATAGEVIPSEHADHIVPLSRGGGWSHRNGQGLCAPCHGRKTALEGRAASAANRP